MYTLTLTLTAGLVEAIFSIVDCVLFMIGCTIKGALVFWFICFLLWLVSILLTGAYKTIKSLITTNK